MVMGKVFSTMSPMKRRGRRPRYDMTVGRENLGDIYARDMDREPAPIVSLSVGSTGINRTAKWVQKMTAMGCEDRIQSICVYDCNSKNIREWNAAVERSRLGHLSITPRDLPLPDGFMREPNFYMEFFGAIQRDVERMVDEMERKANEAGTTPQIILEWLGFGGHARLAYLVHDLVAQRFPQTKVLPIFCFPAEKVLEANIRDYNLWEEAEEYIGTMASVITDNRSAGSVEVIDERIALALAGMEACFRFKPEVGSIGETISMFNQDDVRWVGIETIDLPYRKERAGGRSRRGRREATEELFMSQSAVVHSIKEAIWRIADTDNEEHHTARFVPPEYDTEQRIYCLLPFHHEVVEEIKNDVEDQLARETFSGPYPGTQVAFAPANSRWRENDQVYYGHVCKISGMPADPIPPTIARILEDEASRARESHVLSRGEALMMERGQAMSLEEARPRAKHQNLQAKHTRGLLGDRSARREAHEKEQAERDPAEPTFRENHIGQDRGELVEIDKVTPVSAE